MVGILVVEIAVSLLQDKEDGPRATDAWPTLLAPQRQLKKQVKTTPMATGSKLSSGGGDSTFGCS